ncbi:MAG: GMC family oxidoreductase [Actinomycetota bacterium]|nr:GMC family oxidoreductase [Actinomycetota bacterium]
MLAARLSESGRSVCLVEAGPDYGPYREGRWPKDILDARQLAFSHAWETDREDRSQLRARIIGGCSAHNACVMLEGAAADYDEWGHGWSHAVIEPYLRRAAREMRVRGIASDDLSPWHRAFVAASEDDAIVHEVNAVGEVRWNAAFAYLDPARARDNLKILADMLVDRVVLKGDRVAGVTTRAGELRAETVVLAAGAYGSPGILLRSGIGPQREMLVGEGLTDHVGVGFGFEGTDQLQRETEQFERSHALFMAQVTLAISSSTCAPGVCDLFVFPGLEPTSDRGYAVSAAVFAMKPLSRGSVRLTSRDPRAPLAIDHGFVTDPRDAEVLIEGVEALRRLAGGDAIRGYAGRETRPGTGVDPATHVRETARGFFHPVATCAIGRVVDGSGRVYGIDGLFVADASIMPTIPRANTNLSTLAVAERIAEYIGGSVAA